MSREKLVLIGFFSIAIISVLIGGSQNALAQVPPVPSSFTATVAGNGVDVNTAWNDTPDETSFKVFRRPTGGAWIELYTTAINITSWINAAVPAGTYEYQVAACNTHGCSGGSNIATVTIAGGGGGGGGGGGDTTPPTISAVRPENIIGAGAQIKWTTNEPSDSKVVYGTVSGNHPNFVTSRCDVGGNVTDHCISLTGLAYSTVYYYKVKSSDAAANEGVSPEYQFTSASSGGGGGTLPPAPSGLTATLQPNGTDARLAWTDMSSDETEFKIHKRPQGGTWAYHASAGANATTYTVLALSSGTHEFHINACNVNGCSIDSNVAVVTVSGGGGGTVDTTPPTLSVIRPENIIGAGAQIKWTTNEPSDSKVVYGTVSGNHPNFVTSRCDVGGNVTDHCINLTGLAYATVYYYKVKSMDAAANEATSVEYQFTSASSGGGPTPPAPSGLTTTLATNGVDATLRWTDMSSDEMDFKIFKRPPGGTWVQFGSVGANITSYTAFGLPSGTHEFHINACNVNGCSIDSNVAVVTVSGTAPPPGGGDTTPPGVVSFSATAHEEGTKAIVTVKFSEPIRPESITHTSVFLYPVSHPWYHVPGMFTVRSDGFDFITQNLPDVEHIFVIQRTIKDIAGNEMQNDYMSARVKAYSACCPTYPYPPNTGTITPHVTGWGLSVDQMGKSTIGIAFNTPMDQATFTDANVFLHKASDSPDPAYRLPATFQKSQSHMMLVPTTPLTPGVEYISVVKTSVKSLSGVALNTDAVCRFTAIASGYYTSCPTGPTTGPIAPPTPIVTPTATLEGSVTDSLGKAVPNVGIYIVTGDYRMNFRAISNAEGLFRVNVAAGTYRIEIFPPFGRTDLIKPQPTMVSVADKEVKTVALKFQTTITLIKNITGKVTFSNGTAVTDARVGAYSQLTHQWTGTQTDLQGNYTLRVGPGKYTVGIMPVDPLMATWQWSGVFPEVVFENNDITQIKTVNFTVPLAAAKIKVLTVDELGNPIVNAGVVIDTFGLFREPTFDILQPGSTYEHERPFSEFKKSDAQGIAVFSVTPGSYSVRGFSPEDLDLLNPQEQLIRITTEKEEKEVRLVFQRLDEDLEATVYGTTVLEDGTPVSAFLWAWSDKGGFEDGRANDQGQFTLTTSLNDRWHIGAGIEVNGFPYKAAELILNITQPQTETKLVLTKFSEEPLPPPIVVTEDATEAIIAQAEDGSKVVIPETAAASTGTVSVEWVPTVEAPAAQTDTRVVGTVYDLTITEDTTGTEVKQLQQQIEIRLPYTEEDLKAMGVTEDTLVPSYFDEQTNTWVKIDSYTIDKENNVVICQVSHVTRFALVAPADITAPETPTNVKSTVSGVKEVTLRWTDPKADFHHTKVYRSEQAAELGAVLADIVTTGEYKDTTVTAGKTYYYTLKAVDAAGNESQTAKVTVRVTGKLARPATEVPATIVAAEPVFTKTLRRGQEGPEVKNLQKLLQILEFFPQNIQPNGVFGPATAKAVKAFQKSEELSATGVVNQETMDALNDAAETEGFEVEVEEELPQEFTKNFGMGAKGDDVTLLQEILQREGFFPEDTVPTGVFGPLTKKAVREFQKDREIEPTGFVGPKTRAELNTLL